MKIYPQNTFVLLPLHAGPLAPDKGTISSNWTSVPGRKVMRDGQVVTIYDGAVTTFTGKLGTLTIRDRNEWVSVETGARTPLPSAPGRSCAGPVSTPGSSARAGVVMRVSVTEVVCTLRGLLDLSVGALNQAERCARAAAPSSGRWTSEMITSRIHELIAAGRGATAEPDASPADDGLVAWSPVQGTGAAPLAACSPQAAYSVVLDR